MIGYFAIETLWGTLLPKELYGSWLRCLGKRASMRVLREGKEY